ncbi:MAG: prepilin peptidase [Lachnospiraceae bacterium]|nr:prepilin peptidase [Lachnospiraceae bacterium]
MLLLRMIFGKLEVWQWILMAAVLIPCTIKDIRTKRINGYICLFGILAAIFVRERILEEAGIRMMMDAVPGIIIYIVAFLTKEKIGKGDALSLIFIGMAAGIETVLSALFISLSITALLSGILLILKKVKRDTKLPFLPFLSIGVIAGGLI